MLVGHQMIFFVQSSNQLFRKLFQEYVQSVKTFDPNKA